MLRYSGLAAPHGFLENADYAGGSPFAGYIEGGLPLVVPEMRVGTVPEENFSAGRKAVSGAFHERSHACVLFADIDAYPVFQDEVQAFGGCGSGSVQRCIPRRRFGIGLSASSQKDLGALELIAAQCIMKRGGASPHPANGLIFNYYCLTAETVPAATSRVIVYVPSAVIITLSTPEPYQVTAPAAST